MVFGIIPECRSASLRKERSASPESPTMNHEGANKGILVSTSSYGPDAYDFIRGKPIELIDGGGLLYYLEQHAGIIARIVFPIEG
jgi:hypothetical protein